MRWQPIARLPRRIAAWLCEGRIDYRHFRARRCTAGYARRRNIAKNVWIGAGILVLLHPTAPFAALIALGAVCATFAILDET